MDENKRNNKFMYVYNRFTRVYLKFFVSDWNSFIELRQVIVMCNCLIDNFQNRISHSWPCLDYGGFINMRWIPIFVDFIVKLIHEIIDIHWSPIHINILFWYGHLPRIIKLWFLLYQRKLVPSNINKTTVLWKVTVNHFIFITLTLKLTSACWYLFLRSRLVYHV